MSGGVKVEGLDDLMRQLTDLPKDIRERGMEIVREETEGAAVEIAQAYPQKTGTLAARVKTTYPSSAALIGVALSTAPHSHLFEFGTKKPRQTKRGANRGVMPAEKITPAIAERRRDRMFRRLKDMLVTFGLTVSE